MCTDNLQQASTEDVNLEVEPEEVREVEGEASAAAVPLAALPAKELPKKVWWWSIFFV